MTLMTGGSKKDEEGWWRKRKKEVKGMGRVSGRRVSVEGKGG